LFYLTQVATYQKPSQNKLKAAYLSAKQRFFLYKNLAFFILILVLDE